MSAYNTAGCTLSEKNVGEEFFLGREELDKGIENGKLKAQWRSFHGHSYRLFIRDEIVQYARTCAPDPVLKSINDAKMLKQNLVSKRSRLEAVKTELNGIDAKKIRLANEKMELEIWLSQNDPKAVAKAAKDEAKLAAKEAKAAEKKRKLA